MERKAIDFSIQEAGCLLYAADSNLGGKPFSELHHFGWQDLTLKGALMGMSLGKKVTIHHAQAKGMQDKSHRAEQATAKS